MDTKTILIGAGAVAVVYYYVTRKQTPVPTAGIACTSFNVTNDAYSYSFNATWTNYGSVSNTFTPSISQNGTVYPVATAVTLAPNQQYVSGWITEAVAAGTYAVCPAPTGATCGCQTVTISIGSG